MRYQLKALTCFRPSLRRTLKSVSLSTRSFVIPGCKTYRSLVSNLSLIFPIVSVFTDQEKEKTDSDFAYYNMKADGEGAGENLVTDPFAD
jgi:hypothetical protein